MIHAEGGQVVIRLSLADSPQLREALKSIPAVKYNPEHYYWTAPLVHIREVAGLFPEELYHPSFAEALREAETREYARQNEGAGGPDITNKAIPPWGHQVRAYEYASRLDACLLNMEMGTGKSRVAVDLVQNDSNIWTGRVLILAPKTVVRDRVWEKQFEQYCQVPFETLTLFGQTVAKRKEALEQFWRQPGLRVAIINHEAIWRKPMGEWLSRQGVDWLIVDESHRAKTPMGKFSRWLGNWAPGHARRRLALTGTPMPHSPLDIWAQFRFLDPSVFGGSYTAFRNRYAQMVNIPSLPAPIVKGYKNLDELERRMDTITFTAGPEVLDLPEEVHIDHHVELETYAMRRYRQLEKEFITQLDDGVVTAGNALVRLLRLQQLTSGWLHADDSESYKPVSDAKREALEDLVGDMAEDERIVVFARFHKDLDDIERVADKFHRQYFEVSGRKGSDGTLDAWRGNSGAILGVQIQSGGVGIDLTAARYCVYYSLGFSLGDYLQSLRRIHRPGQEQKVTYWHLVAKDTIDETVYKALQQRRDLVEAVLEEVGK